MAATTAAQLHLVARARPLVTLIGIDPGAAIRERAPAKLAGVHTATYSTIFRSNQSI
jgi:hypothetical protein